MTNILIVGAGIALLSGCGQKTGGEKIESQNNKKTLTVWTRDSTAAAAVSAAEKYNKLQDKVAVEVVQQVNTEIANQFTLSLSANEAPDIISLDCTKVPYLAAEGLFTAIISAIFAVEITRFCDKNHLTIKMPESVPPMVADSFSILVPLIIEVLVATGVAALCQNIAGMVFPQVIMKVLAPAIASMDSLPMVMLVVFLTQLLWMFGLHGPAITSSVWAPFAIANATANAAAVAAGQDPTHVFTFGFYYGFLQVSGSGITLGLVLLMMFSKAKSLKTIGRVGIIPSLFGINEPIIFGTPIIMNPFLMIPFVLGPVLIAAVNYLAMSTGLVGLPLWEAPGFLPPGFQAFLLTLDWKAAVMSVLNVVVMTVIYYPFFKMMEADELKKEMAGK